MFKFNIGSAVNGVDQVIDAGTVLVTLWQHGFVRPELIKTEQSNTETTYVITAEGYDDAGDYHTTHEDAVHAICEVLQQDAIAYKVMYTNAECGFLVGPKAEDWGGEFKQEYFIE